MNEYDRLYRQAQRYKELYPKGTRILLLHMGDDPRPVEDDMRGTVMFVDDMSTIHCDLFQSVLPDIYSMCFAVSISAILDWPVPFLS